MPQFPKTPPLALIQPESLTRKACLQHAVLLAKERDHVRLFALQPPTEHRYYDMERKHG